MHTIFRYIIVSIALIIILAQSGIIDAFLVFLMSGIVPGTSFVISPNVMIIGLIATAWVVIAKLMASSVSKVLSTRRFSKRHASRQQRMPKRRYNRI